MSSTVTNQITSYGDYLYSAIVDGVLKISKATMMVVGKWVSTDKVIAVATDGTHLYAGLEGGDYPTVVKVVVATMLEAATNSRYIDTDYNLGQIYRIHTSSLAGHICVLQHTNDDPYFAAIAEISTETMALASAYSDDYATDNTCNDFTELDGYFYICWYTNMQRARVSKILRAAPNTVTHWDSGSDALNNGYHITNDGTYLYLGLDMSTATVLKIDPATLTTVATWTGATGENFAMGMEWDGANIYVGTETAPAKLIKIDPATMATVYTYTAPTNFRAMYELVYDSNYIYAGGDLGALSETGAILKIGTLAIVDGWGAGQASSGSGLSFIGGGSSYIG
jgi:hypothetical protein